MKKILYILGSFIFAIGIFTILNFGNKALAACGGDRKANFNNAGELNCGDEEYRYDPVASQLAGVPIFVENSGRYIAIRNNGDQVQSIIADCPSGDGRDDPCFTGRHDPFASGGANEEIIGLENFANATRDFNGTDGSGTDGGPFCSLILTTDCYPWAGNKYDNFSGDRCDGTPNGDNKPCRFTGAAPAGIDDLLEALDVEAANETDSCEDTADNPLSFILCPLERAMVEAVDGLTGFLLEQLKIEPITDYGTGGVNPIQRGFNSFRNIANSLYILIFLVIILSNFISVGLDNYSIKKMLPRLLFAVIATQFAFLICSLMIDLSNVLIVGLPGAVGTIPGAPDTLSGSISVSFADVLDNGSIGGTLQGIGLVIFILLLGVLLLVVVAIALAYLIFRNVFLIVLVFLSPLAIAAWVLPQTQSFAKKWANWFIKLIIMGPIIALILAITLLIAGIFQAPGNSEFIQFIAIIVPFIGFAIIPKSLKWSGDVMQAAKGAVAGSFVGKGASAVGGKAKEKAKKSASVVGGVAGENFGRTLSKRTGGRLGSKMEARGKARREAPNEELKKSVESLDFERQVELSKGSGKAAEIAKRVVGAKQNEILNKRMLSSGDVDKLTLLHKEGKLESPKGVLTVGKDVGSLNAEVAKNGTALNPFWNGNRGGAPADSGDTPITLAPPPPPPTGGGSSSTRSSSGSTGPSPASPSSSSPAPSSSSPSSRWRAATPRPNPAGTSGPRVIPGTGGAVDLGDLTGGGSSAPPEPPPGTTE